MTELPQSGDRAREHLSRRVERGSTAMTIFLILNGLSVVFLVYVLLKFWREGRRMRRRARTVVGVGYPWPTNVVVAHPVSPFAQGGLAVLPLRAVVPNSLTQNDPGSRSAKILQMSAKPEPVRDSQKPGSAKFGVR